MAVGQCYGRPCRSSAQAQRDFADLTLGDRASFSGRMQSRRTLHIVRIGKTAKIIAVLSFTPHEGHKMGWPCEGLGAGVTRRLLRLPRGAER